MKSSTMLIAGIGVVGLGAAAFFYFRNKGVTVVAGPGAQAMNLNGALLQQPSQLYPVQPQPVTRQDTASQPWYGGARPNDASASIIDPNLLSNVATVGALADATKSLTSVWNDLGVSNWFSSGETGGSVDDPFSANFSWG